MLRSFRFWLLILLVGVLVWFSFSRHSADTEIPGSDRAQAETSLPSPVQTDSVSFTATAAAVSQENTAADTADAAVSSGETFTSLPEQSTSAADPTEEISDKLEVLSDICPDLAGWIYVEDSDIDYPVVQGEDNQFYLSHAPDKRENQIGSIFLDKNCSHDFSSPQNILYGHNMQSGMFGDIRSFKERDEFDNHKTGWLYTTTGIYRIDFFSLAIISAYDPLYDVPADHSQWLEDLKENSMYYSDIQLEPGDTTISLSTCASDFDDARALFTGKLVWTQDNYID